MRRPGRRRQATGRRGDGATGDGLLERLDRPRQCGYPGAWVRFACDAMRATNALRPARRSVGSDSAMQRHLLGVAVAAGSGVASVQLDLAATRCSAGGGREQQSGLQAPRRQQPTDGHSWAAPISRICRSRSTAAAERKRPLADSRPPGGPASAGVGKRSEAEGETANSAGR